GSSPVVWTPPRWTTSLPPAPAGSSSCGRSCPPPIPARSRARWPPGCGPPERVRHLTYVAVLAGCLAATAPPEGLLPARGYARWRRLLLTLLPVVPVFVLWDLHAIGSRHWTFDTTQMTGVHLGRLPLDELLFFLVVPVCAVLTLEAVRAVRGWPVGDRDDPPV